MSDSADGHDPDGDGNTNRLDELERRLAALRKRMEEGLPARADELRDAANVVESDPAGADAIRRLAHRLRGVAGTHGHEDLGRLAAELEDQARAGASPAALARGARALADAISAAKSAPEAPTAATSTAATSTAATSTAATSTAATSTAATSTAATSRDAPTPRAVRPLTKLLLGKTIAALDDDDATRRLLELTLGPIGGAHARVVQTPTALYEVVRAERVDLVVVDAMMPGATGWDVVHALCREHGEATPRCAVLSAASASELGWTFEPPLDVGWLRKPFRPSELVAALAQLLTHR